MKEENPWASPDGRPYQNQQISNSTQSPESPSGQAAKPDPVSNQAPAPLEPPTESLAPQMANPYATPPAQTPVGNAAGQTASASQTAFSSQPSTGISAEMNPGQNHKPDSQPANPALREATYRENNHPKPQPASQNVSQSPKPNEINPNPASQAASASSANPASPAPANPGAFYGANQFWGKPGFNDPLANQGKPLQSSVSWDGVNETRARRRGPGWVGAIGIAVVASLITSGGFYTLSRNLPAKAEASKSTLFNPQDKGVSTPAPVVNSTSQNPDWESVAKAVRPAVVAIMVRTKNQNDQGSGAIIDSDGHILTNNHVVAAAADGNGRITVELHDGRLYKAEIVGRDVLTDLAVIKIVNPPKDLTVVALGDSSKLRVGEAVAAIGNPLGLSSTVTTGIVSALDRPVRVNAVQGGNQDGNDDGPDLDLRDLFGGGIGGSPDDGSVKPQPKNDEVTTNAIQVDAAVNPGNSGGPLFDAKGRVIGVTSSIASLSSGGMFSSGQSGSIGLGFAIPINQAKMIATQLIEHGEAVHAALGVVVSEDVATVGDVSRLGAAVQEVSPKGAAYKAGLKTGDIIVGIDGKQVKGSESLVGWVRQYAVGDTVDLQIVRDGKEMKVSATLQAQ